MKSGLKIAAYALVVSTLVFSGCKKAPVGPGPNLRLSLKPGFTAPPPSSWTVRELLPENYHGPTLQVGFVTEEGVPVSLDEAYLCSKHDPEGGGATWSMQGAQSVRMGFVDHAATDQREMKAGISCYGIAFQNRHFEFDTPPLKPGQDAYTVQIVLPAAAN